MVFGAAPEMKVARSPWGGKVSNRSMRVFTVDTGLSRRMTGKTGHYGYAGRLVKT